MDARQRNELKVEQYLNFLLPLAFEQPSLISNHLKRSPGIHTPSISAVGGNQAEFYTRNLRQGARYSKLRHEKIEAIQINFKLPFSRVISLPGS